MRDSFNGRTSAFQADSASSILASRSKYNRMIMTEFEKRMLALREREVQAIEMQAKAARDNELRNGKDNYWIPGKYVGSCVRAGARWAYGPPDNPENHPRR